MRTRCVLQSALLRTCSPRARAASVPPACSSSRPTSYSSSSCSSSSSWVVGLPQQTLRRQLHVSRRTATSAMPATAQAPTLPYL